MRYYFYSPTRGPCQVIAYTSGIHGFGAPKRFVFSPHDSLAGAAYTCWYRDNKRFGVLDSAPRNFELLRIAIAQFCAYETLYKPVSEELDQTGALFIGVITNQSGSVVRNGAFQPKRSAGQDSDPVAS